MDAPDVRGYLSGAVFTFEGSIRHSVGAEYCDFHSHAHFEIVQHVDCRGTVSLEGGESVDFEAGGVIIHPPRLRHAQQSCCDGADLCVLIGGPAPPEPLKRLLYVPPILRSSHATDIKILSEAPARRSPLQAAAYDHRAAALFLELIEALQEAAGPRPNSPGAELAVEAEYLIHSEYARLRTVNEIAARLSVSASHLRHVYKQHHGVGIKRRLMQVRLDHACELLATSTLPIKAISAMCGFENDRYFSASFSAQIGCVPGEYRRNWKGDDAGP